MPKIVLLCAPLNGAMAMNADVDGKLEIAYPVFDKNGYPIYEGGIQFISHFLRSDKRVRLVDGSPITTHVIDGAGNTETRTFYPHAYSMKTRRVEDIDGNDVDEPYWEWVEQRDVLGAAKPAGDVGAPAPKTKIEAMASMKARYVERFGRTELFDESVSTYRNEIEKPSGEFDKKEFSEIMTRLKAGLAE